MRHSARWPVCGLLLTIAFACCANEQNQAVPEDLRAFAARRRLGVFVFGAASRTR